MAVADPGTKGSPSATDGRSAPAPRLAADATDAIDQDPILVVDDESTIVHILKTVFEQEGRRVLAAGSAEEGLAHLMSHTVAVAVVDIVLPKMSGLQLLDEARKISPDTRIILMTSHASVDSAIEAIHLGAYDYIQKPFDDIESVWLTVKRALDHRSLALRNASLLDDQRRKNALLAAAVSRLGTLIDAGTAMGDFHNTSDLLEHFLGLVVRQLDAERASVMIVDRDSRTLRIAASHGLDGLDIESIAVPLGEGISGRVAATGEPMLVHDITADPVLSARSKPNLSDSFICAPIVLSLPIKTRENVLGVLNVTNRAEGRSFDEEDLGYLASMTSQLAVAIERTRFVEELQRAYESLKQAQSELVFSERVKAIGEIAAGVAHDYNNTLGAILARVQLALHRLERQGGDPGAAVEDLRIAEKVAEQGTATIKRIQDFARRRGSGSFASLDVNAAIRDAIEMTRPKWKDECESDGRRIDVDLDLGDVPAIHGDAHDLTQVVSNLVFNAVDAMPRGGALRFRTRSEGAHVIVEIADEGDGIPADVQARMFDPFFTTKSQGHGLGLSIVRNIVARHGGDIGVSSEPGQGATIRIRLPEVAVPPVEGPATKPEAADTVPETRRSFRVLVVDDLDDVRESVREMLIAGGHAVTEAKSGAAALSLLVPGRFDLVVTDLGMPDVSGFEVAKAVKRECPGLPVILLSGWAIEVSESRARDCQIDCVLPKPCPMDDLLLAVDVTVRGTGRPRTAEPVHGTSDPERRISG